MLSTNDLVNKKSHPTEQGLLESEILSYLTVLDGWKFREAQIVKAFAFKNFYETMAFVNALAYVVHAENHHPELVVSYNRCTVKFSTHSINGGCGGISENDFICAAKIEALFNFHFS